MISKSNHARENLEELMKKSNDVKKALDHTPFENKTEFLKLLKSLVNIHRQMDEIYD